jgi:dihydrofolate reductase
MVILVWAMDKNGVIGKDNKLPWCLNQELQYFKEITIGKTILMGRKTFASLKVKPLSQRKTIVVSWNPNYEFNHPDVIVSNDLEGILKQYEHSGDDLYVCGGGLIYQIAIPYASKLFVSLINDSYGGDTYFPEIDFHQFKEISKKQYDKFVGLIYERKVTNE